MIIEMQQGSPEWLKFRRSKIGASDAPIIMGMSPWKTPYELWLEKTQDVKTEENASMSFGKANEAAARQLFEEMTGFLMMPNKMAINPLLEWQIASLDGIDIFQEDIVEIKCANAKDHELAKNQMVPDKYMHQLQHQMACADVEYAYYFSYHKGEGIIVKVWRIDSVIYMLTEAEKKFYEENILGNQPPKMTEKDLKKYNVAI